MGRGVSTVVDVAVACLLVTASATLLVTVPDAGAEPPDAGRVARAVVPSTLDTPNATTAAPSVGSVLVDAATTGSLSDEHRRAIRHRITAIEAGVVLHASSADGSRVVVGERPPPGVAVDAAVLEVGRGRPGEPAIVVTVRTWSP